MRKFKCLPLCFLLVFLFTACSNQLQLPHHIDIDSTENQIINSTAASIPISRLLTQIDEPLVDNIESLKPILEEINKKYSDFASENWKVTVNYFSDDKSAGNIVFKYFIGDLIITNKSVTCLIENDVVTQINYSNIDMATNETTLLDKVNRFAQTHTQEKKQMVSSEMNSSPDSICFFSCVCVCANRLTLSSKVVSFVAISILE